MTTTKEKETTTLNNFHTGYIYNHNLLRKKKRGKNQEMRAKNYK